MGGAYVDAALFGDVHDEAYEGVRLVLGEVIVVGLYVQEARLVVVVHAEEEGAHAGPIARLVARHGLLGRAVRHGVGGGVEGISAMDWTQWGSPPDLVGLGVAP